LKSLSLRISKVFAKPRIGRGCYQGLKLSAQARVAIDRQDRKICRWRS